MTGYLLHPDSARRMANAVRGYERLPKQSQRRRRTRNTFIPGAATFVVRVNGFTPDGAFRWRYQVTEQQLSGGEYQTKENGRSDDNAIHAIERANTIARAGPGAVNPADHLGFEPQPIAVGTYCRGWIERDVGVDEDRIVLDAGTDWDGACPEPLLPGNVYDDPPEPPSNGYGLWTPADTGDVFTWDPVRAIWRESSVLVVEGTQPGNQRDAYLEVGGVDMAADHGFHLPGRTPATKYVVTGANIEAGVSADLDLQLRLDGVVVSQFLIPAGSSGATGDADDRFTIGTSDQVLSIWLGSSSNVRDVIARFAFTIYQDAGPI